MLVLIAGITGTCGQCLARAALAKGHQVRGLGRNPGKLGQELADKLEGFVQSEGIYDIAALDRAVRGVDAIVCAYTYAPETVVDGQILLLRAAERAGVKVRIRNGRSSIFMSMHYIEVISFCASHKPSV